MDRLPKAARSAAVIAGLLVALLAPAVAEARGPIGRPPQPSVGRPWTADAAELARTAPQAIRHGTTNQSCTGWRSTYQPPDTIRVLRTRGPAIGTVQSVDFRTYVGWVLATEWTNHYPMEALKVGAVAVKQYGWYYTIVYRGGVDSAGNCYDVVDNTNDQYYDPDATPPRQGPIKIHLDAIAATWNISVRKYSRAAVSSRFFLTGYRSGSNVACGADKDGFRLYQRSIFNCSSPANAKFPDGAHDLDYEQILRLYLNPNLELVSPSSHNVVGPSHGDVTVLGATGTGTLVPRIYERANLRGISPAGTSAVALASDVLLGTASMDINTDGHDDLVTLVSTGANSYRIDVSLSDGTADYQSPTTWLASTDAGVPVAQARLMFGDYNADSRLDVGVLLPAPLPAAPANGDVPAPRAELRTILQRKDGTARDPVSWWSGNFDLGSDASWAGDFNGDGATDLLVAQAVPATGATPATTQFSAALSSPPSQGLGASTPWIAAPDLVLSALVATVGDANRDGLDDLYIAFTSSSGATQVDVLRSNGKRVIRLPLWTAPSADPAPLGRLKLETSDINADGISDLVLYQGKGAAGTRISVLRGTYAGLKPATSVTDASLDWATAIPY